MMKYSISHFLAFLRYLYFKLFHIENVFGFGKLLWLSGVAYGQCLSCER